MNLLLDSHVLIWLAEGLPELPQTSRERIDRAAREHGVAVSAVSFWEIAMLHSLQRITLSLPILEWRRIVLESSAITEAPLTGEIGIEAVHLPGEFHADPADRMLVATARVTGWRLATRDSRILRYSDAGHVKCLEV